MAANAEFAGNADLYPDIEQVLDGAREVVVIDEHQRRLSNGYLITQVPGLQQLRLLETKEGGQVVVRDTLELDYRTRVRDVTLFDTNAEAYLTWTIREGQEGAWTLLDSKQAEWAKLNLVKLLAVRNNQTTTSQSEAKGNTEG